MGRFEVGSCVERREVLHGRVWESMRVRVVADDDVLALWLADGTPLTFPPHPFGPHPWAPRERFTGRGVLQVQRPGGAHAAWAFFHPDGRFDHWYVNFQAPFRRRPDAVETSDHGIDIVVHADRWEWKDRDDPAEYVRTGRFSQAEADAVYEEADRVAAQLERGERWWMGRWGDWRPASSLRAPIG